MTTKRIDYRRGLLGLLLALVILVPSLLGFGNKFLELIRIYRGDADGAFAVSADHELHPSQHGIPVLVFLGRVQWHVPRYRATEIYHAGKRAAVGQAATCPTFLAG